MRDKTLDTSLNVGWIKCSRKQPYSTRKVARDAATRLGRRYNVIYRSYPCDICGAFHLTSGKEKR